MYKKLINNQIVGEYNTTNITNWISVYIEYTGIKSVELAKKLGVSESILSQWMSNSKKPTICNVYKIADVIGINMKALISSYHHDPTIDKEIKKEMIPILTCGTRKIGITSVFYSINNFNTFAFFLNMFKRIKIISNPNEISEKEPYLQYYGSLHICRKSHKDRYLIYNIDTYSDHIVFYIIDVALGIKEPKAYNLTIFADSIISININELQTRNYFYIDTIIKDEDENEIYTINLHLMLYCSHFIPPACLLQNYEILNEL